MKYFLKTPYPCLVRTTSDFCELENGDTLEIENEKFLLIYPQESKKNPFYINLQTPTENENFSILSHDEKSFIVLEPEREFSVEKSETFSANGKTCVVTSSLDSLTFDIDNKKIVIKTKNANHAKISKVKNFVIAQMADDTYALSLKTMKMSHFSGQCSFDGDKLVQTKSFDDSLRREKTATYQFDEGVTPLSEKFDYSKKATIDELVPYRLLESVKSHDYAFAFDCLSNHLKEKINQDQIKEFFGTVQSFLPLSTTEFITLSPDEKNYVKFDLQKDKISDITIDKL